LCASFNYSGGKKDGADCSRAGGRSVCFRRRVFDAVSAAYRRPAWRKNGVTPEDLAQVGHDLYDHDLGLHAK